MVVRFIVFLNSATLICQDTDISACLKETIGIRDNERRLYFLYACHYYKWKYKYSKSLMTLTPKARLPGLIRTRFWFPRIAFDSLRKQRVILRNIFWETLILLWKYIVYVLIRIAPERRFSYVHVTYYHFIEAVNDISKLYHSLRKHAYSNILKFLPTKKMKIFR